MKVLLSIFSVNEQILHIGKILKDLDCDVEIIYADSYRYICPYYMKKIDELGIHIGRNNYLESIHKKLNKSLHEFKPDVTLFINIPKSIFSLNDIKYINKHSKTICWLVDGIKGDPELCEYLSAVRQIYVFEYEDVSYLNSMNIKASYLPVGYNDAFFDKKCKRKDIDILFIGSPFYNRLELLEKVAFEANKNLWNLKIIGPFYEEKYPWKKMIFKKKYPYIFRYLNNTRVSSEEAAALYSRTKICLNIHDSHHKSPNPRTFEILAAKAFYNGPLVKTTC